MELIDRYVHEVGEHLPNHLREDVETELRSLLMDTLEERARAAAKPIDSELASRVLREFGPPNEVARRYLPEDEYLIGPRLFPVYKKVVTLIVIVFSALFLASFVLSILATVRRPENGLALSPIFGGGLDLLKSLIFNFALVTIAFGVVERIRRRQEFYGKDWDPQKLLAAVKASDFSPVKGVIQIYMILLVAVVFNFYPQLVGYLVVRRGISIHSILLPEFSQHLWVLNAFFAAVLAFDVWSLRADAREVQAREWGGFILGLLGAGVLAVIIAGPPVFLYDTLVKQALELWLVILLLQSAWRLYKLLARKPVNPLDAAGMRIL